MILLFFRFRLTVSKDTRIASDEITLTTLPISSQSGLKLSVQKISSDTDPIVRILGHISDSNSLQQQNSQNSQNFVVFNHQWKFYECQKNTNKWILAKFSTNIFTVEKDKNGNYPLGLGIYSSKLNPEKNYVSFVFFD